LSHHFCLVSFCCIVMLHFFCHVIFFGFFLLCCIWFFDSESSCVIASVWYHVSFVVLFFWFLFAALSCCILFCWIISFLVSFLSCCVFGCVVASVWYNITSLCVLHSLWSIASFFGLYDIILNLLAVIANIVASLLCHIFISSLYHALQLYPYIYSILWPCTSNLLVHQAKYMLFAPWMGTFWKPRTSWNNPLDRLDLQLRSHPLISTFSGYWQWPISTSQTSKGYFSHPQKWAFEVTHDYCHFCQQCIQHTHHVNVWCPCNAHPSNSMPQWKLHVHVTSWPFALLPDL